MRDISWAGHKPLSWWVYVSRLSMPTVFHWDAAFVRLLEYHNLHPPADGASLAYVDCAAAPFLCVIWQVEYPALVHFKVHDEPPDPDNIEPAAWEVESTYLRPVDVRIFDLGLQFNSTTLLPGQFPTEFEQMRSLTSQSGAYESGEIYNDFTRVYDRFNQKHWFPACNRPYSFLDYTSDIDNWILKHVMEPIGLKYAADVYAGVAFTMSAVLVSITLGACNEIINFVNSFTGQPTEFDKLAERIEERQNYADAGGFMGEMFGGFMDAVEADFEAKVSSSTSGAPSQITTDSEARKSMFAGLRKNVSTILAGA